MNQSLSEGLFSVVGTNGVLGTGAHVDIAYRCDSALGEEVFTKTHRKTLEAVVQALQCPVACRHDTQLVMRSVPGP